MLNSDNAFLMDALLPAGMAAKAEEIGVRKSAMDSTSMFMLAVLAGAFIALGAVFATTVAVGASGSLPLWADSFVGGAGFVAWPDPTTTSLLRNWVLVYLGN